jgi:predicted RecB family endonuclease
MAEQELIHQLQPCLQDMVVVEAVDQVHQIIQPAQQQKVVETVEQAQTQEAEEQPTLEVVVEVVV